MSYNLRTFEIINREIMSLKHSHSAGSVHSSQARDNVLGSYTTNLCPGSKMIGMSSSSSCTDQYIKPLPGYTTEYEAEFKWPEKRTYDEICKSITVPLGKTTTPRWNSVMEVCNSLITRGVEVAHFKQLQEKIKTRQLDASLEAALNHTQNLVREQVMLRDAANLQGSNREINSAMVSEEVFELYLKFIDKVYEVKNA